MTVALSSQPDIPEIFRLYRLATELQKEKFPENQWPEFSPELVTTEVTELRQFKMLIDNQIACVWAITYHDPQIWEEEDNDYSLYIHRIATNPDFRGNNLVKQIADWAREFAQEKRLRFIRMDTCGYNQKLINHYTRCGFEFLGSRKLKDPLGLPAHYQQADVCFFEIKL
ncbi:MAG: GNAT family N-acetyltransferase [Cyclobacteriaceae bacterium]